MTLDTRTDAEIRYDAERDGTLYVTPSAQPTHHSDRQPFSHERAAATQRLSDQALAELPDDETIEPTMYDTIEAMLETHDIMPTGNQIYDLLLEDRVVSFTWCRCIDWVLYRLAHNLPVKRLGDDDTCPAAINARYLAARAFHEKLFTSGARSMTETDIHELGNWGMIERWQRTPAEERKIREDNELIIAILEEIDGGE